MGRSRRNALSAPVGGFTRNSANVASCVDGPRGAREKKRMGGRTVRSCVRLLRAAQMAAGPDEIRGSTFLIIPTSSKLNDTSGMCRSPVRPVVLITNTLALAFGWVGGFPIGNRYVTVSGRHSAKQFLGSTECRFSVPTPAFEAVTQSRFWRGVYHC
jgi:hypothetical protein